MIKQLKNNLSLLIVFVLLASVEKVKGSDPHDKSLLVEVERPFERLSTNNDGMPRRPPLGRMPYYLPLTYYGPLDRFWKAHSINKSLVINGVDYYPKIETCLNEQLSPKEWTEIRQPQNLDRVCGVRFQDTQGLGPVVLVEIKNATSPIHAKAVKTLKDCVKTHLPQLSEKRPMYQVYKVAETENKAVKEGMGGNNPTHLNSIIGMFLPDFVNEQYKTLKEAYEYAGWNEMVENERFVPADRAGMRACEYLDYKGFNNLMEHQDGYETHVVLNLFLSKADDYEGGEFYIQDRREEKYHRVKPDQYSAALFLGGSFNHGVDPIRGGTREALSTEFWHYPDLPFGVNLCSADYLNIEQYVSQCNSEQINSERTFYDYSIPCTAPFPSESVYGICTAQRGTKQEKNVYKDQIGVEKDIVNGVSVSTMIDELELLRANS